MANPGGKTTRPADRTKRDERKSAVKDTPDRGPRLSVRESVLLRVRRRVATRRPTFRREESWRYTKLDDSWRRPRGGSSKMRLCAKGWPAIVRAGYRGPRTVRGLNAQGFREVLIHTENDLQKLDPKREAVRIAHTVGARRRASIVEKAKSLQLTVVNPGAAERKAVSVPEERQEA